LKPVEVEYEENGITKTKFVKRRWDHAIDADEINAAVSMVQGDHKHGTAGYKIDDKGNLRLTFTNNEDNSRKGT